MHKTAAQALAETRAEVEALLAKLTDLAARNFDADTSSAAGASWSDVGSANYVKARLVEAAKHYGMRS